MPASPPAEPGKFRGAAGSGLIPSHLALAITVCPPWPGAAPRSEVPPLLTAASPVAPVSPVPMCGGTSCPICGRGSRRGACVAGQRAGACGSEPAVVSRRARIPALRGGKRGDRPGQRGGSPAASGAGPDGPYSDGPVHGQVQHDGHHDGQRAGRLRDRAGELHRVVIGKREHLLGEPGPGLAYPRELGAPRAGDGEVLERQVAGHLAHGLVLIAEQGVAAPGGSGADPADQLVPGTPELGDPFAALLDQKPDRLAGGRGDRERAGVGHRHAEQRQPGMAFGFGGGRQRLPVGVEDLVVRAVRQQLSWLLNPQRLEVKGVSHGAEYAALAPAIATDSPPGHQVRWRLPGQTRQTPWPSGGGAASRPTSKTLCSCPRGPVTADATWFVITPEPARSTELPRFN